MTYGNKPADGGNLILTEEERQCLVAENPELAVCIRQYVGAKEFINGGEKRYCLWLRGISPKLYSGNKEIMRRLGEVSKMRLESTAAPTRLSAETPYLFFSAPQKETDYLCVPQVSSEKRKYIPIGFMSKDVISSNANLIIPDASLYHFGVLTSTMHMAWMRTVAGRLKSDYRYSGSVVYNTFPWPEATESQIKTICECAELVLKARALYPDCSLADLYKVTAMPPELVAAHRKLDAAVEKAYGRRFVDDSERVAFLFERYRELL